MNIHNMYKACENDDLESLIHMKNQGLDIHINNDGMFTTVATQGYIYPTLYLMICGAQPPGIVNILYSNVRRGNLPMLKLLDHVIPISEYIGYDLAVYACMNGRANVLDFLIGYGFNIQNNGLLRYAYYYGHLETIKCLIRHGLKENRKEALLSARHGGHPKVIAYLEGIQ